MTHCCFTMKRDCGGAAQGFIDFLVFFFFLLLIGLEALGGGKPLEISKTKSVVLKNSRL